VRPVPGVKPPNIKERGHPAAHSSSMVLPNAGKAGMRTKIVKLDGNMELTIQVWQKATAKP
jgi:hypothetical protein